jgi:hypothetical protein
VTHDNPGMERSPSLLERQEGADEQLGAKIVRAGRRRHHQIASTRVSHAPRYASNQTVACPGLAITHLFP